MSFFKTILVAPLLCFVAANSLAQLVEDKQDIGKEAADGAFWFPYIFQTDASSLGYGLGYSAGAFGGAGSLFVGGFATANGSWGLSTSAENYQIGDSRWYFDSSASYEDNEEQRFYGDPASFVGDSEGGTHGSSPDDFLEGPGQTILVDAGLRYILAIGDGKDNVVAHYLTDSGSSKDRCLRSRDTSRDSRERCVEGGSRFV